jgi:lipopolysaccharide export system protein LptC
MERRTLLSALVLAVPAALSTWLLLRDDSSVAPQAPRHVPDYYLKHFTATAMTPEGKPDRRLTADSLYHYADDDTMDLERPHMLFFNPERPPWEVDSETGWVGPEGEDVLLGGNVIIRREAAPDGSARPLRVETRDLQVRPHEDYAETDQPVTIISERHRVDAVGMRAYLGDDRLELLSEVRGHYEPETP